MTNSLTIKKTNIKTKTITTAVAIITAIVLPQIFHAVGVISGLGSLLGETFLPMQLPILLAGLLAGPVVGIIAGAASPSISFILSGMPGAAMLPFIMIELAGYGLTAGLLNKVKIPVFFNLILAQIAGRTLRIAGILFAVYGMGIQIAHGTEILNFIAIGLPGILLQLCLIPLLMFRLESVMKFND